jgi:dipeptidyl aminopeptidase/acylaminoacyl peptidase
MEFSVRAKARINHRMYHEPRPGARSQRLILFLFALTFFIQQAIAAPKFSIEQALGAPFPSDLVAAPKGDAVAWVSDAQGVRNVLVAQGPDFKAAMLTPFTQDDGQEIDDIAWLPDGSGVYFTRGGEPNGHGENPNPTSNPAGFHQEIWFAPLQGAARRIGYGHTPCVSSDGSMVAWVFSGQVWSAPVNGSAVASQLIHARGSAHDLVWSPDGSRLAFASDRGDHAAIGVYDARGKALHYVDASVDSDRAPVWSADGKQLAFIRVAANKNAGAYGAKRSGQPWSLRVADESTGKGREIWRASEGAGSVYWGISAAHQLVWTPPGKIIFPWEKDGWLHLYSVAASGGEAKALTPGAFEVDNVTAAPDGLSLLVSSNVDGADRRSVARLRIEGGPMVRLSRTVGIEWAPAVMQSGKVAVIHADAKNPARPAVMEDQGRFRDLTSEPFAPVFTDPQAVAMRSKDGTQIHGQLFFPAATGAASRHPAVVFFHGGSRRQMLLGWHPMQYYNQAYAFNQYLASRGYVVLSINYRSGVGYGMEFREALKFGPTGASEFDDVLAAGNYLRGRPDVDSARIGVWGGSYGGYLVGLALARASDTFAVGVDLHGINDWNLEFPNSGWTPDVQALAYASSPLAFINTWKSPVLLIQGDDDRNVAFAQTVQVVEALRKQGVPFEQLIFPDEIHDFLLHSNWLKAYRAADEYLARYLKP